MHRVCMWWSGWLDEKAVVLEATAGVQVHLASKPCLLGPSLHQTCRRHGHPYLLRQAGLPLHEPDI